jgi:phosphatidylinositol glycan class W
MDAGVGGFMFSAALTSPFARRSATSPLPLPLPLLSSVKRQLPVLALGCLRLLAVKLANYQEHVTEYGVHWNFFFTLAAGHSHPHTSHSTAALLPNVSRTGSCSSNPIS